MTSEELIALMTQPSSTFKMPLSYKLFTIIRGLDKSQEDTINTYFTQKIVDDGVVRIADLTNQIAKAQVEIADIQVKIGGGK